MIRKALHIGNAQAFWGDRSDAPAQLAAQAPDLDCLTLDYLAEVSMSILARQKQHDPAAGYARDFLDVVQSLAPLWREQSKLTLVTNAGGLAPHACAMAAAQILENAGCSPLKIAILTGDDVLDLLRAAPPNAFPHLETGRPLHDVLDDLVTANAYLGARPVAQAISAGAHLVITGRVADPSLTVGPCMAHFAWKDAHYHRIAGATVAGHLIECGTQATGGISTHWLEIPGASNIGFPIVEVSADGSCVLTKPPNTGGCVDVPSVKEQLLYEIGDPAHYLSPDVTASFLPLHVQQKGKNRVAVRGAKGTAPPAQYKVSATYRAGFRASGMLVIFGRDALAKARRCGQIVRDRLRAGGSVPQKFLVECLGAGDVVAGLVRSPQPMEVVLRLSAADPNRAVIERFARELVPLVTAGPPGTTGYFEGRPPVREVFGYWPTLIDRKLVQARVEFIEI